MITERQLEILNYLQIHGKSASLDELLDFTKMSERTIRYDISNLRFILKESSIELRYSPQIGFFIPINQHVVFEEMLGDLQSGENTRSRDDSEGLIYQEMLMMFGMSRYVSLDDFIGTLYISERGVYEYIANFESFFDHKFKISNKRNHGYYIIGCEYDLRFELARLIVPYIKHRNTPESWYRDLPIPIRPFISINRLTIISDTYKKLNAKHQVWLDHDKFYSIFSYLIVRYSRLEHFLSLDMEYEDRAVSEGMRSYCEHLINDKVDRDDQFEFYAIVRYLQDIDVYINDLVTSESHIELLIEGVIHRLEECHYNANYKNLYDDLFLHFQSFLNRKKSEKSKEEVLVLKDIKKRYSKYYELAKYAVSDFEEKINVTLSDEEIGYIAIYLFKNKLEESKRKRVIVVCSTGRGLSTLLVTRVKHVFPQLEVVGQLSFYQLENSKYEHEVDFIISTMPLQTSEYPVVTISNILSSNDIRKIHDYLNDEMSSKILKRYSLSDKVKPLDKFDDSSISLVSYSKVVSEVTLELIELTTEIADEYPMNYDAILGLTIHLLMAIPRWFANANQEEDEVVSQLYAMLELEHPLLVKTLDTFFANVENVLLISISIYERFAFYQYILRRKDNADIPD